MNHEKPEAESQSASVADAASAPQAAGAPPPPENPLIRRFQIAMAPEEIAGEIDRLAGKYSQKMKMPGFRQGKVPVEVVKKVHPQALREEVIQQAIGKLAFAHIEKTKLAIAGEPFVEKMNDREDLGFEADIAVEVLPEVELPDLAKLKVEVAAAVLKGEAFQEAEQVERVLEAHKRSLPVAGREVAENDLVLLLVQSTDAGSKRKWPRQETYFMMNRESPSEIPGLFDALLGKKTGEKLALQGVYAADAAKKAWAGKKIEHQVEIKALYELKKPELDGDFLKSLGLKTPEEFKAKLKEEFQHHQEHRRDEALMEGIYEKLLEAARFPVPRSLQEQEVARRLTQNRQGLNFKDEAEKARFKELVFAQAEKAVRLSLILEKVREEYQIVVSEADLEKEYAHLAKHHALPEKEIRRYYSEAKKAEELKEHLLHDKVSAFLRERIKVKEV
ncbi:MAG: trigger factor [Acidobacteria bacterium]|jgi:trigger factor|nr:trigger factor [Acidobacteriota bacterium]